MPKTFPIMIEVEEIALGTVLRKLNDMAGVAKLHLDLGKGGETGQQELVAQAAPYRMRAATREATVLKFLGDGPKRVSDIIALLDGKKSGAYGATHALRKQGLIETMPGSIGVNQLTAQGRAVLQGKAAIAAPTTAPTTPSGSIPRTKHGRTAKGVGEGFLLRALNGKALRPIEAKRALQPQGFSESAVEALLRRAVENGVARRDKGFYSLTAKGLKQATPHGSGMNGTQPGEANHG